MFEGVPNYPDPGRFWEVCAKHKVNQYYTAPTAIRSLTGQGPVLVEKHDLSSLKLLGSVGEPINPQAWNWYNTHVGKGKGPIVDAFGQMETGGQIITPLPGAIPKNPDRPPSRSLAFSPSCATPQRPRCRSRPRRMGFCASWIAGRDRCGRSWAIMRGFKKPISASIRGIFCRGRLPAGCGRVLLDHRSRR